MKKLLVGTSILAGLSLAGAAQAADMPLKAPRAVPYYYNWTGCYIGGNAGFVRTTDRIHLRGTDTDGGGFGAELADGTTPSTFNVRPDGFIGGGQVGCNWQSGAFVWGLEGDFDGASAKASASQTNLPQPPFRARAVITTTMSNKLDWLSTLRARFGVTPSERVLLYVTGGVAFGETEISASSVCPTCGPPRNAFSSNSKTDAGWVVGGGAEYAFGNNWSIKGEALWFDLGKNNTGLVYDYGVNHSTLTATTEERGWIARGGLNYKF